MSTETMRLMGCLAAMVAAVSVAGCASSEVPVSAAEHQAPDARLIGSWRGDVAADADDEIETFRISRLPDGRLALEDGGREGPAEREEMLEIITAEISGGHYASIGALDADEPRTSYLLVRYELVSDDRLQLHIASMQRLEGAVQRGWIDGRRQADRHVETFQLTADSRRLREFIASHGSEVFADAGPVLERLRAQ